MGLCGSKNAFTSAKSVYNSNNCFFMKTLTITYHHNTNYGAVLQAYAHQNTNQELGHENDILECDPTSNKEMRNTSLKQKVKELYIKYLSYKRRDEMAILKDHFKDFHKRYLRLTKPYHNMDELRSDPNIQNYDCLIAGSDQVWNLRTTPHFIDSRLLLFGSEKARRFSYAASLEELNYTEEQKQRVANALKQLDGISIREDAACKYVESFSGLKCERVIDPVFLLTKEEWMNIAKQPRLKGPYILCYQVQRNTRMQEVANKLKKQTGYPIVSICNSAIRWIKSDYTFYDVSIEEFLGFYNQAEYIVSASFHGIAMGLVFDKPVYAMVKEARANRLRNVMELMRLQKYIVVQENKDCIYEYQESDIELMQTLRENERNIGFSFLKRMLS